MFEVKVLHTSIVFSLVRTAVVRDNYMATITTTSFKSTIFSLNPCKLRNCHNAHSSHNACYIISLPRPAVPLFELGTISTSPLSSPQRIQSEQSFLLMALVLSVPSTLLVTSTNPLQARYSCWICCFSHLNSVLSPRNLRCSELLYRMHQPHC